MSAWFGSSAFRNESDIDTEWSMLHKEKIERLYRDVKFPNAIDWWSSYYARDELDVLISNSRHLDGFRQSIEDKVWKRIVPEKGQVLDLACGRGFFSNRIQRVVGGNVNVIGLDLSETILQKARSDHAGISFVLGSGEKLPFQNGSFDTVMVVSAFEHIENQPDPIIHEIHRVLKKGGYFYLSVHKPFVDPFLIPNLVKRLNKQLNRVAKSEINSNRAMDANDQERLGYRGTLRELRRRLKTVLTRTGLIRLESKYLLHQFNWRFYKKISPGMIPSLISIGKLLNRLPFGYYKNLEYWLLQKPHD